MFNTPMSRWMLAILCLLLGLLSGCILVVHLMNWMQYGVHFGLPLFVGRVGNIISSVVCGGSEGFGPPLFFYFFSNQLYEPTE